jgi:membrane-associated phospholipid phosphatase
MVDKDEYIEIGKPNALFVYYPGDDQSSSRQTTRISLWRRLARSSACRDLTLWTFLSLLQSAIPYIMFLLIYAANCRLLILPTSEGGGYGGCSQSPQETEPKPCSNAAGLFNIGEFEKSLFQFTPNLLVASVHCPAFDLLSTIPYLAHYIIPIVYPLILVLVGRVDSARQFYRLVGWTMWMHYFLWFLLPTGPPWYYSSQTAAGAATGSSTLPNLAEHGLAAGRQLESNSSSISAAAAVAVRQLREGPAFARVDAMTGRQFFRSMFAGNPVPYAAFPSGHVAWPTCIALTQPSTYNWPFVAYVAVVAWATMYSGHHYLSDVIGALVVVFVVNRWLNIATASAPCVITIGGESCLPTCGRLQRILSFPFRLCRRSSNGTGSGQSQPRQRYMT